MPRYPYPGGSPKLLLAFDVGTTFSGISYSFMEPDRIPEIRPVTRFPGWPLAGADCTIPTEIYYDSDGKVQAAGAQARRSGIEDTAKDEGWTKVEWFTLHMRPLGQRSNVLSPAIPPLPPNKTAVDVFSDFLRYLNDCAEVYLKQTLRVLLYDPSVWESISRNISYVLTHPNGWEGSQRAQMREAAIRAGLVTDDVEGRSRVTFVTEGEASLHFCISRNLAPGALENGEGIVLVDADGCTIDVSAYKGDGSSFHETSIPQCRLQGSAFVTRHAKDYIKNLLERSDFEYLVSDIVDQFDARIKLQFRDSSIPQYIQFGSHQYNNSTLGIRNGRLRLAGETVASFFKPLVGSIIQAVKEQVARSYYPITHVFLVGEFSTSIHLFQEIKTALAIEGLRVSRPDNYANKSVPAAEFAIDSYRASRISSSTYGILLSVLYNGANPEHQRRKGKVTTDAVSKLPILRNMGFDVMVYKGESVSETQEFRRSYSINFKSLKDLHLQPPVLITVLRYRGNSDSPQWTDMDKDQYTIICKFQADLKGIQATTRSGPIVQRYYSIEFDIIIFFGRTELKAELAWIENGIEERGHAKAIFDDDPESCDFSVAEQAPFSIQPRLNPCDTDVCPGSQHTQQTRRGHCTCPASHAVVNHAPPSCITSFYGTDGVTVHGGNFYAAQTINVFVGSSHDNLSSSLSGT